jgi:hypothetical protein
MAAGAVQVKCPTCKGEMRALFSSFFCPKDCDRPRCDLPPSGWSCTRARGHSGPCAAKVIPSKVTSTNPCGEILFLDYKSTFDTDLIVKLATTPPPTKFRWEIRTYGTEVLKRYSEVKFRDEYWGKVTIKENK